MVLVRRISMQDALKLAIFLTLVTFSSNMQDNDDAEVRNIESPPTTSSPNTIGSYSPSKPKNEYRRQCPSGAECSVLGGECLLCNFHSSCVYGQEVNVTCEPFKEIECLGNRTVVRSMVCQYCYQMEPTNYNCKLKANCNSVSSPRAYFQSNCTVKSEFLCMGNRVFLKNLPCNWTGGYKWSTALLLSITLGGFGADRFYLGHWQEAIGKLFSFGGLGVWTLVDVVLIWLHYLGPADGSLYI